VHFSLTVDTLHATSQRLLGGDLPIVVSEDCCCRVVAALRSSRRTPASAACCWPPRPSRWCRPSPHVFFWGRGVGGSGAKHLGLLLTRLREELEVAGPGGCPGPAESLEPWGAWRDSSAWLGLATQQSRCTGLGLKGAHTEVLVTGMHIKSSVQRMRQLNGLIGLHVQAQAHLACSEQKVKYLLQTGISHARSLEPALPPQLFRMQAAAHILTCARLDRKLLTEDHVSDHALSDVCSDMQAHFDMCAFGQEVTN